MIEELGTKWDFELNELDVTDTKITGYADTAWSPPLGWFKKICKHYRVNGELKSGEGGNDYGCLFIIDGGMLHRYESPFNHWSCLAYDSPEEFKDMLTDLNEDYPEYIENLNKESEEWPKSWEEYKERFWESSTTY